MLNPEYTKQRFFGLTDISEEEPDDLQSLIRLLLYSNAIDIEGLVATSSEWKAINGTGARPDLIRQAINAYEEDRPSLLRHSADFPEAGHLRGLVAAGNGNDLASTGTGKESGGAELLVEALEREDPRPLWVGIWGGASTLTQALQTLRDRHGNGPRLTEVLKRLRVYEIQGQDDAGAWVAVNFPEVPFIRSQYQFRALSNRVDGVWPEPRRYLDEYVEAAWFARNIRSVNSALGRLYPDARYMFEGDTPSILHLIPNGLHDPDSIHQGGWGGRFLEEKTRNVWSGGCPVNDEGRFGDFFMHTDAADALPVAATGKCSRNVYNPLRRWRNAYQNDFAARMAWTVLAYADANHAPVAVVDGDPSREVLHRALVPGASVRLDASKTYDPDGDSVSFTWWIYRDCGTRGFEPEIRLEEPGIAVVSAPEDSPSGEAHLILEVTDSGAPPLKAYRRIVLKN